MRKPAEPDVDRCQAVRKPRGRREFGFGRSDLGSDRCGCPTEFVAVQDRAGEDGFRGGMGLCAPCLSKLEQGDLEFAYATVSSWDLVADAFRARGWLDG